MRNFRKGLHGERLLTRPLAPTVPTNAPRVLIVLASGVVPILAQNGTVADDTGTTALSEYKIAGSHVMSELVTRPRIVHWVMFALVDLAHLFGHFFEVLEFR